MFGIALERGGAIRRPKLYPTRVKELLAAFLVLCLTLPVAFAEPVPVLYKQGATHGFLVLKSSEGKVLAVGDQITVAHGNRVRSRLTIRFRDGSIDDETTEFIQGKVFRVLNNHHVQKGPSFPKPMDLTIDVPKSQATWREMKDGKDEVKKEHLDLSADVANGILSQVIENFPKGNSELKVPYVAGTSKPRVVQLVIRPEGEDSYWLGGMKRKSTRFNVHVEIGGLAGAVAPLVGKQPSDTHVWVMEGQVPGFLRMEGALYDGGPIWNSELTSPVWSEPETHNK